MVLNLSGGGAPALNFKVVGGTEAPANPAENTIWVNTDTTIPGWAMSLAEPAEAPEGTVWLKIGLSGKTAFNLLRKNSLIAAPMAAKQCIGGVWETVDAVIWQDGAWQSFNLYLIADGHTEYTINAVGKPKGAGYIAMTGIDVAYADGAITFTGKSDGFGMVYIENIDLTNHNTLTIEGTFTNNGVDRYALSVWSEVGAYTYTNLVTYAELGETGAVLDISNLSGVHAVGFLTAGRKVQTVTNLYLS